MAQTQLYYIATSKVKSIRGSGEVSYKWGNYSSWKAFKSPKKSSYKEVKYDKTSKNKAGASKFGGAGGATVLGTHIPATATRYVSGVEITADVRYYVRGYTKYTRTEKIVSGKKQKKMYKSVYTKAKPYQYRLQYKDKPVYDTTYSGYDETLKQSMIFFANRYYKDGWKTTSGHLLHPQVCDISYSDVQRNLESKANNTERDNKGKYVLQLVRANVVTLRLEWQGLSSSEGADLLDTLNPTKQHPYIIAQYRDPVEETHKNKTFFASSREVEKYPNGTFKRIAVTLTEV